MAHVILFLLIFVFKLTEIFLPKKTQTVFTIRVFVGLKYFRIFYFPLRNLFVVNITPLGTDFRNFNPFVTIK